MVDCIVGGSLRVGQVVKVETEKLTMILCRGNLTLVWYPVTDCKQESISLTIDVSQFPSEWVFALSKTGKLPPSMKTLLKEYF